MGYRAASGKDGSAARRGMGIVVVGKTPPSPERTSLERLEPGRCATIESVAASGRDAALLMSMGVCPGRRVVLLRHGDPMILKVLGARIGVSARLAEQVTVVRGVLADCRPDSEPVG